MADKFGHNEFLMNLFLEKKKMKTKDYKRMVKLNYFFSKFPFLDIY